MALSSSRCVAAELEDLRRAGVAATQSQLSLLQAWQLLHRRGELYTTAMRWTARVAGIAKTLRTDLRTYVRRSMGLA
ncbi:MAG: hypothetical protein WCB01_15360, partial [Candidatus Cybelea sp.]